MESFLSRPPARAGANDGISRATSHPNCRRSYCGDHGRGLSERVTSPVTAAVAILPSVEATFTTTPVRLGPVGDFNDTAMTRRGGPGDDRKRQCELPFGRTGTLGPPLRTSRTLLGSASSTSKVTPEFQVCFLTPKTTRVSYNVNSTYGLREFNSRANAGCRSVRRRP